MIQANPVQYDKYTLLTVQAGTAPTPSPEVDDAQAAGAEGAQKLLDQDKGAGVSNAPQADARIVAKEEKIEYRDQDGNLLNDEQVKALEGKVEFQTKYETKTRVINEEGNEVSNPEEAIAGVAPPHPDVEGVDKETIKAEGAPVEEPHDFAASRDGEKEAGFNQPKPASEGKEATVHEEL